MLLGEVSSSAGRVSITIVLCTCDHNTLSQPKLMVIGSTQQKSSFSRYTHELFMTDFGSRPSPFMHAYISKRICGTRIVAQERGRPGLKYHVRVGSG